MQMANLISIHYVFSFYFNSIPKLDLNLNYHLYLIQNQKENKFLFVYSYFLIIVIPAWVQGIQVNLLYFLFMVFLLLYCLFIHRNSLILWGIIKFQILMIRFLIFLSPLQMVVNLLLIDCYWRIGIFWLKPMGWL